MSNHRLTSRRRCLKDGAAGVAGTVLLSSCADPRPAGESRPRTGRTVVRALGRTGLKLPVVSMGSCYAINLVRTALDEGIAYIHTSSGYSEKNHERLLGEVFRGRDRESFVVGTSPDLPYEFPEGEDRSLDLGTNIDPDLIEPSLDGSLERLKVDAVDIYYLAGIGSREVTLFEPYMEAYDRLKPAGNFCQQCGRCRPQCPAGMDVPTWMRASMYAFGHGQIPKARETLRHRRLADIPCTECSLCEVSCSLGHDIRSSTLELARLLKADPQHIVQHRTV